MVSKTTEQALESAIEKALTGTCAEEIKGDSGDGESAYFTRAQYGLKPEHGYVRGEAHHFNREFAVDTGKFWDFLRGTQPEELAKLTDRPNYQRLILERLGRKIKKDGIVKMLKAGLRIDDARFELMYSPPYNDINPDVAKRFEDNIFSVTRQVHYSDANPGLSIDMVLFINGMAVATLELKNPWTGQSAWHARKQYRENRDPGEPLFQFGRCLVHFAMDTDEVYMTTRLAGKDTWFLPFNKGFAFGKGNPPNPRGHKTAYLWEEVLTRDSLANIVEHFAQKIKNTLFFPRYHQLEVVRSLLAHARERGPGQTCLIQHSAGSGKSNSITWLAYQLIELYKTGAAHPLFDSVVVVTDRRLLDRQLRNNIKQFSEVKNIVAPAFNSRDLKRALESGKKVIITTIQKFPYIVEGIDDLSDKRFAVIIDEAHSSQSGVAADNLNKTLGADEDEVQDAILEAMRRRKMRGNASYFAFTATPKNATLEKFGRKTRDGKFEPFHLYSMKQAIEEGFILDVLANYTTYKSYYEIQKAIRENPRFDSARAQKKLRAHVEGHKETIAVKAEIMVSHFMEHVAAPKKLKGKARGMVVTRNITTAVRYFFAVRDALARMNAQFKALVAFSGRKTVDGVEYDEAAVNGLPSRDIEKAFDTDDYRLLVVANKFLTGFDQPTLSTMYIDKKLQGVLAVQALSRLNRCNPALGKRTEDVFVLDFYNTADDIEQAFDPFYTSTTLSRATDVNVLHDLKEHLDGWGVYERAEVEAFNELYFANAEADKLSPIIDLCAARFNTGLEM
ncbi:MAG: type I restriction endonuclease subunit R, partial [Desulfobacterales bacterium]|nr:type I restriction endonuclease subunit R [Desulfobacterales bacterium]